MKTLPPLPGDSEHRGSGSNDGAEHEGDERTELIPSGHTEETLPEATEEPDADADGLEEHQLIRPQSRTDSLSWS